jgi:cysteine desulfuration protein SufE
MREWTPHRVPGSGFLGPEERILPGGVEGGGLSSPAHPATVDDLTRSLERFRSLSREMRLQALLGYARRFPALPAELEEARDQGLNRVEECQTPLFLWVGIENGGVRIHADAPREAPMVRGFMGFLMDQVNGAPPEAVDALPADLLERMGLAEVLGVTRARGLGAVLERVRRDVRRAREGQGGSGAPP